MYWCYIPYVTCQYCFEVSLLHTELMKWGWIQKLSEYVPSMKLDDYSFELHQECVNKCRTLLFTCPHVLVLLTSNSLLSMMIASLASVIQLSLTYPHVPDEAQMNNHQASYLVSIHLIFVFLWSLVKLIRSCNATYLIFYTGKSKEILENILENTGFICSNLNLHPAQPARIMTLMTLKQMLLLLLLYLQGSLASIQKKFQADPCWVMLVKEKNVSDHCF